MKSHKSFFVALGVILISEMSNAGNRYPVFQGEVKREINRDAYDAELFSSYPLLRAIAEHDRKVSAEEIETQLNKAASFIAPKAWPVVDADEKMALPQVLIGDAGIVGGLDSLFRVNALSASAQERSPMEAYALLWATLLDQHPQRAFELMAERAAVETVSTIDVLHVTAAIGQSPGNRRLSASPNRADWEALYRSRNPCYRFLALELFDSVPQSPQELLSRYRECLFGACGYLESRALVAINRNEDFREAVAKLLEAYVASNPTSDDGTAPRLYDPYHDRIRNSTEFAKRIRKHIAAHGEKMPAGSSTTEEPTQPAKGSSPPETSPAKQQNVADATTPVRVGGLTMWLLSVVAVIIAGGILWWMRKCRK